MLGSRNRLSRLNLPMCIVHGRKVGTGFFERGRGEAGSGPLPWPPKGFHAFYVVRILSQTCSCHSFFCGGSSIYSVIVV